MTRRAAVRARAARIRRGGWRRPRRRGISGRAALAEFTLASAISLLVLAVVGWAALRSASVAEAVRQARELVAVQTRTVVQPAVTDALAAGEPAAVDRFDLLVRRELDTAPVVRVKLWTADGRVVYADDRRLIGMVFPLAADDAEVLRTGVATADLSDLSAQENVLERSYGQLLQVYERVVTPTGTPLLFEVYLRFDSITADAHGIAAKVAPAFLLAFAALLALQLPVAWRLIRRVRLGQRERDALQTRALDASDAERRRIARELHDGVVQRFAGVAFSLASVRRALPAGPGVPELAARVDAAADTVRDGVVELRTLVAEIQPPELARAGLPVALAGLLEPLEAAGVATSLDLPPGLDLPPDLAGAIYRTAREALRNVAAHAAARTARVAVDLGRRAVAVRVSDDGAGFDPGAPPAGDRPHLGLRLLADMATEAGGRFEVRSAPGGGTDLRLELPR